MNQQHPQEPDRAQLAAAGTIDALPIAPALADALTAARIPRKSTLVDKRTILVTFISMILACASELLAQALNALINRSRTSVSSIATRSR